MTLKPVLSPPWHSCVKAQKRLWSPTTPHIAKDTDILELRVALASLIARFEASNKDRQEFREEVRASVTVVYSILWKAAFGIIAALGSLTLTLLTRAPSHT